MKKVLTLKVAKRLDYILERIGKIERGDVVPAEGEIDALCDEYCGVTSEYNILDVVFEENGKKGVRNAVGRVLVPAIYKEFSETYIYTREEFVMPIPACDFNNKYAIVKGDGKGTPICPFEYDMITFLRGSGNHYLCKKGIGGKVFSGIIKSNGEVVVPCEMDLIHELANGFSALVKDGKIGIYTIHGDYFEPQFDDADEEAGFLKVYKDGAWGYLNGEGEFIDENDEERLENEEVILLFDF